MDGRAVAGKLDHIVDHSGITIFRKPISLQGSHCTSGRNKLNIILNQIFFLGYERLRAY